MKYIILDLETTTKTYKGRKASPFCRLNKIVTLQYKLANEEPKVYHINDYDINVIKHEFYKRLNQCELLIGHNIKFDLLYLWSDTQLQDWLTEGGRIYDTMLSEYILSGQTKLYPSLDYCAEKYGGTLKDNAIKQCWEAGLETTEINQTMLSEYAAHDVINTELVAKAQAYRAKELGMTNLIRVQMDALLATTEMEYNGLYVDRKAIYTTGKELALKITIMQDKLKTCIKEFKTWDTQIDYNPNSTQQLSLLLFGGSIKYKEAEPVLDENGEPTLFKSGARKGEVKTKLIEKEKYIPGLFKSVPSYIELTPTGNKQLNEASITKLLKDKCDLKTTKFLTDLLNYKDMLKQYNTYFLGWLKLVSHNKIHGTLNHVGTDTGRLSSSQPNLQNLPRMRKEEN